MQQKKREADERSQSEKRGWNRLRSSKTSEEREQQEESDFRSNSPPIPTMRGKESDMKGQDKDKLGLSCAKLRTSSVKLN